MHKIQRQFPLSANEASVGAVALPESVDQPQRATPLVAGAVPVENPGAAPSAVKDGLQVLATEGKTVAHPFEEVGYHVVDYGAGQQSRLKRHPNLFDVTKAVGPGAEVVEAELCIAKAQS